MTRIKKAPRRQEVHHIRLKMKIKVLLIVRIVLLIVQTVQVIVLAVQVIILTVHQTMVIQIPMSNMRMMIGHRSGFKSKIKRKEMVMLKKMVSWWRSIYCKATKMYVLRYITGKHLKSSTSSGPTKKLLGGKTIHAVKSYMQWPINIAFSVLKRVPHLSGKDLTLTKMEKSLFIMCLIVRIIVVQVINIVIAVQAQEDMMREIIDEVNQDTAENAVQVQAQEDMITEIIDEVNQDIAENAVQVQEDIIIVGAIIVCVILVIEEMKEDTKEATQDHTTKGLIN